MMRRTCALVGLTMLTTATPLMAQPAPTFAWVSFDHTGVTASSASGLADRAEGRALTIDDPVRIASISKLVVAIGVMRLVEQGRLSLDQDVSRYLGWPLRNPRFPRQGITLRLLMSHRASLVDANDEGLPPGQTVRQAVERPGAFDPEHAPGSYFRYGNLNWVVIAAVMEGATGERFDRLMQRLVLKPLGLNACFGWATCADQGIARGVTLYGADGQVRADGREGEALCLVRPVRMRCSYGPYVLGATSMRYSPQGGLRISMADLARIGQLLLNGGTAKGQRLLRRSTIEAMIGPEWTYDGRNGDTTDGFFCSFGLGVQSLPTNHAGCADRLLANERRLIGHAGQAYGLLSGLWVDMKTGQGIAFFSANESGDRTHPPGSAFYAVERVLAGNIDRQR